MSEWGHDFRPDYLRLASIIKELGHPPTMACTATATPKVAEEIVARLGLREPERVRSGFDRPNLSFDVLPFDGEGTVARKRATLVAGVQTRARTAPRSSTAAPARAPRRSRALLERARLPRRHARRTRAPARRTRSCAARPTSSSRRTRSGWASTRPTCARSGTGRSRPASRPTTRRRAARAATASPPEPSCSRRRSDLGRLVRFIHEAEVTVEQVGALVQPPARQGDLELDDDEDRDRILLAVAERAGALTLAPGAGGRVRVTLAPGQIDRGRDRPAVPRRDRPPLAVLPLDRALRGHRRPLPPPPAARPLRRPDARRAARPLLRRPRPAGLAPADHDAQAKKARAGRGRPAGLRRRARAAEGLAPRARRRQARLHGRHRRDAARGRPPQAARARPSCWRSRASARRSSPSTPTRCWSCSRLSSRPGCAWCHSQASRTMSSSERSGRPARGRRARARWPPPAAADRPRRRPSSSATISRPVTARAVSITSRTE